MDSFKNNFTVLSWADEDDEDTFAKVSIPQINDISKDPKEQFYEKEKELLELFSTEKEYVVTKIIDTPDKPENLNVKYIEKEEEYKQMNKGGEWKRVVDVQKLTKKPPKCYTCFPRRKVTEHVIQTTNGVTFHHDMCNRNMIVATPEKHFSTLENVVDIGKLFQEVHSFCKNWNIIDYSVTYNQGEWQTHSHFHLKIKTHESIIKRLRGDHFRCLSLQKTYR